MSWQNIDRRRVGRWEVFIDVADEVMPLDVVIDLELFPDLKDRVNRGLTYYFHARARCYAGNVCLGEDQLGALLFDSYDEFLADESCQDMIESAIGHAEGTLRDLISKFYEKEPA